MPRVYNLFTVSMAVVSLLLVLASTSTTALARSQTPAQSSAGAKVPAGTVPEAQCEIDVDGAIDETCWGDALVLELPYETRPAENTDAPVNTECLFTSDASNLYVGCRAEDPDPSSIRARLTDRDSAFSDDFVGVVLDTFNDERRAFEFFVNPLGVQMDLVMDDVSGREDSSWDAIWNSAGRVTDQGYEIEMAIPFSSLRFQRTNGQQTWGIDILRIYPRNHRYRLGLNVLDRNVDCYLCQTTKIVGFRGAEPGKNLEITPTLTASRADSRDDFPNGGLTSGDEDVDPGLFLRWGMTPNLTLTGTANPDFSQVEADVARLDINEEFALFFPEKRPFFLEGADFFETPIDAVYTRTVADPAWGTKLTGKEGKNAFGAFIAEDERTNLLFPGSEGSDLGSLSEDNLSGVFRFRRDIGKSSAVGAVLTAREGEGDYHNRVFGVDSQLRPTDKDIIRMQFLTSQTQYPTDISADFDQPTDEFSDHAMQISYRHSTRSWLARASYSDFGEDFRADSGFEPRVNYRQVVIGTGYTWQQDGDHWYSRLHWGGDWDQTEDQDGALIERELETWVNMNGPMQSYVFFGFGRRERVFNEVSFDQDFASTFLEFSPTASLYANLNVRFSDRIDFGFSPNPGEARQGEQWNISPGLRYNFGRHLKANLNHTFREFDLPQGELFTANLTELRLVYQFNVRAFFRIITQYSVIDRNLDFFDDVAAEDKDLFSQLLFSYKINPRTALFVGYTDDRTNNRTVDDALIETGSLTQTGRSFFTKLSYAWVP